VTTDHDTLLAFEYDSAQQARRVARAVGPEVGDIDDDRSEATLARDGDTLEIAITASDVVALRASLNTWLSLVSVAEQAGAAA
jgi:KEOPS complex subunit Pcc1